MQGPSVEWPVWVGDVPRPAAAFQPRTKARKQAGKARGGCSDVVLSGPGGVGKSQLAASLARELRDQELSDEAGLDVLVWVRATGTDQVISAYAEAAGRLRLAGVSQDDEDGAAQLFLRWLTATGRRWLVVLDDITDPAAVRDWWPDSGAGRGWVLATSRREDAQLSGQGRTLVRIGLYTDTEARAYLKRRLTDAGHAHLHDPTSAGELAAELGHLPLALGHAAAYLINKRPTMADYLTLLRDTGNRLSELLPASADTEGYGRPVTTSLLLSLDAVEQADTSDLARPLLQLASLMDPLGHPVTTWTTPEALSHLRTARPPQRRLLRKRHHPVTQTEVYTALECLRTYALITQDTATAPLRMHALTARAVREIISPKTLSTIARAAADAIVSLWPALDHENRELSATLRANAIHVDHHTLSALWSPSTHICLFQVSSTLTEAGLYRQAVEYDLAMVDRSIKTHGPDHPDTLSARNNLAVSYYSAGQHQRALELGEQVLADRERVLGINHPATIEARNNVANSYDSAGHLEKALALRERTLADFERIYGLDHPDTLTARSGLAVSYNLAGRTQEAVKLGSRVLADQEQILGFDHPSTLDARINLAIFQCDAGRFQEAVELGKRVLTDRERVLGSDHPDTLDARSNLAIFYSEAGLSKEAVELGEQVLADREKFLGSSHPHTLRARSNLAVSYSIVGRSEEAVELGKQVLADREQRLGSDHPSTIDARDNLAIFRDTAADIEQLDKATPATAPDLQPLSDPPPQPI
ncbi:FxSxx-COOH system tetratricopeptide repeat protein [Streptomyces scabiei]|uniref:FxSxx-COOH system tetratricopeptide repeat protein n=1 Tax=Streptomyces scabiei TaxID=1930 RepID=UPI00131DAC1C|nr:FxSxx-COOH system tetratricopeptide repeat protein [Streptomyces scabiei]